MEQARLAIRWFFDHIVFWPYTFVTWLYPEDYDNDSFWSNEIHVLAKFFGILLTIGWLIFIAIVLF